MSKKETPKGNLPIPVAEGAEAPFLLYAGDDGKVHVNVLIHAETLWLPLVRIAELFDVQVPGISKHLKNIFDTGELSREATVSKMEIVQTEGGRNVRRNIDYYNLDAIVAVGYRVNSKRATQFRIWATQILTEYIKKGFILDDERLKQGKRALGEDYFQELLERVRSIRASERRIYQQITDIFAECSVDYDPRSDITQNFYAMVQNKFHYAITGQTAAEIIHSKADHNAPYAGLLTWKNAPHGRILASDVTVAKNYLAESEIKRLERTISGFFDYIENVIENRVQMTMADMAGSVDKFLTFNEYQVLTHKGRISKTQADQKALAEYAEFNKTQKIESDFDRVVKGVKALAEIPVARVRGKKKPLA
ncbi:MAG: virulence RhuM family protein [Candidatus Nitricoxidivorans perseverans]|uniref:Virulence RhuM family protein n=1 Tax=Candidatus Nitricoxidivorans perseverans TaxID=2975601 RepID=A0AA49FKX9_9PROT|nr:MAG: virulence RhuM family protein [Candidatus Nitricoxidivorans perseverans]